MTHRFRTFRRRLAGPGAVLAGVAVLLGGGSASWAAIRLASSGSPAVVQPRLTADTNAGCNAAPKPGQVRCFAVVRTPASHQITPDAAGPPASALGPADIQSAYKLPAGAGGGATVAIVDALGDSSAESDLATFRAQYGLPACTTANGCFKKVDQAGGTSYPADDAGWGLETSLDLDAVSSACPACNILLVESNTANDTDMMAAVDEAVSLGAKYISNSYGEAESAGEVANNQSYDHPGVVVAASSGDTGNQTLFPSVDPNVVAVGGTTLTKDTSAARGWDETAWSSGGSGCSSAEPRPDDQLALATGCPDNRATADISADADPQSGLAVYDTEGNPGWLQVGGTSLASPLVTAMYALAGPPQPGTYPVTYPYHDPHASADLFDVTAGSNGACGTVLCNAGPGWDGPTGLGTPDGVAALSSGAQGTITGTVTDKSTGKPVAGATITATPGGYTTRTGTDGTYSIGAVAGTYTLTATDYGYLDSSPVSAQVTAGQAVADDFALAPGQFSTVTGTVKDGSGHGWPLYAQISIDGGPPNPVYTNPDTGAYSVELPDNGTYTMHVTPVYPGYQAAASPVTVGTAGLTHDISVSAVLAACTAPGYGPQGGTESFTGWQDATPQDGWTIANARSTTAGWRFDNPGNEAPLVNSSTDQGGDDDFAVADSGYADTRMDSTLTSPVVNLTGQDSPVIAFDSGYFGAPKQQAQVQLSTDGGHTWSTVWQQSQSDAVGHVSIAVPQAAGKHAVQARFAYTASGGWYWGVDNVLIGTPGCGPLAGGLVTGTVTDTATSQPVYGATITGPGAPQPWPAGQALSTGDPAGTAFYWIFSPAGSQKFTATAAGETTATATVSVIAGQVTRHDWTLTGSSS